MVSTYGQKSDFNAFKCIRVYFSVYPKRVTSGGNDRIYDELKSGKAHLFIDVWTVNYGHCRLHFFSELDKSLKDADKQCRMLGRNVSRDELHTVRDRQCDQFASMYNGCRRLQSINLCIFTVSEMCTNLYIFTVFTFVEKRVGISSRTCAPEHYQFRTCIISCTIITRVTCFKATRYEVTWLLNVALSCRNCSSALLLNC